MDLSEVNTEDLGAELRARAEYRQDMEGISGLEEAEDIQEHNPMRSQWGYEY